MMKTRITFVFGLFAALLSLHAAAESKTAVRPNIIFVLCDDLGPGDIGVLWQNGREGKQKFSTPNLDPDSFTRGGTTIGGATFAANGVLQVAVKLKSRRSQSYY